MAVEVYEGALDKGLEGVVACTTAVSSIVDATLCYRGHTIESLAANASFEEIIWLLWNNEQPTAEQSTSLMNELSENAQLSEQTLSFLHTLPVKDVHPMAWLRSAVSALSLWDAQSQDLSEENQRRVGVRLMAKMPTLVSFFHRKREGKDFVQPQKGKTMAWNFLYMMGGEEPAAEAVKVMDMCLTLHADHELNCSAFSTRVTASSLSDIYSAITSGIGALKGPLHGGANEQVMRMLFEINDAEKAPAWVENALANKVKIMGFGHRVYKNGDPRAKILKSMSKSLSESTGNSKWYQISDIIENAVVSQKGLLPNVDFYSATVYYSMGIPMDLFTPIFAVSRTSGWLAHAFEQYSNNRIYRPRGKWVGKENQKWS
ncbi:MAG: citrate/2-methylcitrate synthase [Bdellovibrionales bacterium]